MDFNMKVNIDSNIDVKCKFKLVNNMSILLLEKEIRYLIYDIVSESIYNDYKSFVKKKTVKYEEFINDYLNDIIIYHVKELNYDVDILLSYHKDNGYYILYLYAKDYCFIEENKYLLDSMLAILKNDYLDYWKTKTLLEPHNYDNIMYLALQNNKNIKFIKKYKSVYYTIIFNTIISKFIKSLNLYIPVINTNTTLLNKELISSTISKLNLDISSHNLASNNLNLTYLKSNASYSSLSDSDNNSSLTETTNSTNTDDNSSTTELHSFDTNMEDTNNSLDIVFA
jgi:hypothetical protein